MKKEIEGSIPISIRNLSKKLADSYAGYIMTSAVGDVLFLIMLSYKDLDVQALYVNESVIWLLSVSGVLMKVLGGFGVMPTYG